MKKERKRNSLSPSLSFCWDSFLPSSQAEVTSPGPGELQSQCKGQGGTTWSWEGKGEALLLMMAMSQQTRGDDPNWPQPVAAAIEEWLFLKGKLTYNLLQNEVWFRKLWIKKIRGKSHNFFCIYFFVVTLKRETGVFTTVVFVMVWYLFKQTP